MAADNSSPRQTVEKLIDFIRSLKTEGSLSPKELKFNRDLSYRALALLDLQEVSRKALGKYWNKRTSKEQQGFIELLSQMFVKEAFPNSGKFLPNTEKLSNQLLTLPLYPNMTSEEKQYLIESISEFFEKR